MKRRLIGCIMNYPENIYQQRVMDGLLARCEAYGYDLAVFTPLVDITHFYQDFLHGEHNILELVNYDKFDAVICVSLPLVSSDSTEVYDRVRERLEAKCRKPVITLDLPMGDYDAVYTDDRSAFSEITKHILDVHKCRNIYFLTGKKDFQVSYVRLSGFKDELERRGMSMPEENIFYGDFWYSSGAELGDRIASGELARPDAVICASDHMAIGLINRLDACGIRVPEDVIVTGYDATQEAIINDISVTSFIPNVSRMAEDAIDKIHGILEPKLPLAPLTELSPSNLCIGSSCGCPENLRFLKKQLESSLYKRNRNYDDEKIQENEDLHGFMESYMFESLTRAKNPTECLQRINEQNYLFRPYNHFYLCLRENWLDTKEILKDGYPERMRCVIHSIPAEDENKPGAEFFYSNDNRMLFDTSLMLPALYEERDKPHVFYFMPVHFQDDTLGYAVLQCDMERRIKLTSVFRHWIRNVNSGLEMARIQNRLIGSSLIDTMTGLSNRLGMQVRTEELMEHSHPSSDIFVMVIDMDGLKAINDTYGHTEGDFGISAVASAIRRITVEPEVAVRAGGDEFYIIGVGSYDKEALEAKCRTLNEALAEINAASGKPYDISASAGYSVKKLGEVSNIGTLINSADAEMYRHKNSRRKQRK